MEQDLVNAILAGEAVVALTGLDRVARTATLDQTIGLLEAHRSRIVWIDSADGKPIDLQHAMDLVVGSGGDPGDRVERFFDAIALPTGFEQRIVLVIDDAQLVSNDLLNYLALMGPTTIGQDLRLQILLVGDPTMWDKLPRLGALAADRITARFVVTSEGAVQRQHEQASPAAIVQALGQPQPAEQGPTETPSISHYSVGTPTPLVVDGFPINQSPDSIRGDLQLKIVSQPVLIPPKPRPLPIAARESAPEQTAFGAGDEAPQKLSPSPVLIPPKPRPMPMPMPMPMATRELPEREVTPPVVIAAQPEPVLPAAPVATLPAEANVPSATPPAPDPVEPAGEPLSALEEAKRATRVSITRRIMASIAAAAKSKSGASPAVEAAAPQPAPVEINVPPPPAPAVAEAKPAPVVQPHWAEADPKPAARPAVPRPLPPIELDEPIDTVAVLRSQLAADLRRRQDRQVVRPRVAVKVFAGLLAMSVIAASAVVWAQMPAITVVVRHWVSTPVRPATADPTTPDPKVAQATVERAYRLLAAGEVMPAQASFKIAMESGTRAAVAGLAKTFDPHFLALVGASSAPVDRRLAEDLYRQAIAMGDRDAEQWLKAMRDFEAR